MYRSLFLRHAKKLRPVWTLSYLELTQMTMKTAPKTPSEQDNYINMQIAAELLAEIEETKVWDCVNELQAYIKTEEAEFSSVEHKTKGFRYRSSEKQVIGYIITLIKHIIRHEHHLKF